MGRSVWRRQGALERTRPAGVSTRAQPFNPAAGQSDACCPTMDFAVNPPCSAQPLSPAQPPGPFMLALM